MVSPNWVVDSVASHHVTGDFKNLITVSPYQGSDSVLVGNGIGLSISHTGSLSLSSPHTKLSLHDVLYVPSMNKNLISVSQFVLQIIPLLNSFLNFFR